MDLSHLEQLRLIAQDRSFRRAAEAFGVSRSALSAHIRTLENEVGVPLLERDSRHVTVTPAGQALLDETAATVRQLDQALALARRIGKGQAQRLRVGHASSAAVDLLNYALPLIAKEFAPVDFSVIEKPTSELASGLVNRQLDLALIRPPLHEATLEEEFLLEERLVPIVPGDISSLAEALQDDRCRVLIGPARDIAAGSYDTYQNAYRSIWGRRPTRIQEANSPGSLLILVAAGAGVTFLPESTMSQLRLGDVAALKMDSPAVMLSMHAAWRREDSNPLIYSLRHHLEAAARKIA